MTADLYAALAWLSGCSVYDLARACDITAEEALRELGRLRICRSPDGLFRRPRPVKVSPAVLAAVQTVCACGGPLHVQEIARRAGYAERTVRPVLRAIGWSATGGHGSMWRAP